MTDPHPIKTSHPAGTHHRIDAPASSSSNWRERRYRDLLLSIFNDVWVADARAMQTQIDVSRELDSSIAGQLTHLSQSLAHVHPDDRCNLERQIFHCLSTVTPLDAQARVRWIDNSWRHCSFRGIPIHDDEGKLVEWAGVTYDISDRVAAEEKIRDHAIRLKTALDASRMGIWEVDLETGYVEWSPEVFSILEQSSFDGNLFSWLSLIHPQDRGAVNAAFDQVLGAHAARLLIDARVLRKDDRQLWVRLLGRLQYNQQGLPHRIIGTVQDVTDEVQTHLETSQREAWLRFAIEASEMVAWTYDHDRKAVQIFGNRLDLNAKNPLKEVPIDQAKGIVHPEDHPIVDQFFKGRNSDEPIQFTLRIRDQENKYGWKMIRGRWLHPRLFSGISLDITEQRAIEQALSESQARLQDAQALSRTGSFHWNAETNKSVWTEEMHRIFDFPRGVPMEGYDFYLSFVHPEDRPKALDALHQAMQEGKQEFVQEFRVIGRDQTVRWVASVGRIIRNSSRQVVHIEGTCQDITQRIEIESKLATQQLELLHISRLSTLGLMSAALAHEINQPLGAIANFTAACNLMLSQPEKLELDELRSCLDEINSQSLRAGRIIRRLRDFSTKSTKRQTSCELNGLLKDAIQFVSIELRSRGVDVFCSVSDPSPTIRGDKIQLQQVFVNLIINAADALMEVPLGQRIIRIDTKVINDECLIGIEDCGKGVPLELRDKLFKPFMSTKTSGMGLGLSICKMIVEDHEGEISAEFPPNGRTRFVVRLKLLNYQSP